MSDSKPYSAEYIRRAISETEQASAFAALNYVDQELIIDHVQLLCSSVKKMGPQGAIELLANLGIWQASGRQDVRAVKAKLEREVQE